MIAIDWSHTKGLTTYNGKGRESMIRIQSTAALNFPLPALNRTATFLAKEIYSQIKLAGVENHTG